MTTLIRKIKNHIRFLYTGELYSIVTWNGDSVGIMGVYKDKEYAYRITERYREVYKDTRFVVKKTNIYSDIW